MLGKSVAGLPAGPTKDSSITLNGNHWKARDRGRPNDMLAWGLIIDRTDEMDYTSAAMPEA